MNSTSPQPSTKQRMPGTGMLITGGILLLIDALLWPLVLLGSYLGPGAMVILIPANMLLFLFGFPFAFIGVLLVALGLVYRLMPTRSQAVKLMIAGALVVIVGILALIIPPLIVPAGSGDTQLAWMAGLTALLVGIPLPVIGVVLLIIALIMALRSSRHRTHLHG